MLDESYHSHPVGSHHPTEITFSKDAVDSIIAYAHSWVWANQRYHQGDCKEFSDALRTELEVLLGWSVRDAQRHGVGVVDGYWLAHFLAGMQQCQGDFNQVWW